MMDDTVHNPDRYMVDLRQILSQGKKRIGLLIGAGAPTAIRVDETGQPKSDGEPLIPDVTKLTDAVINDLCEADRIVIAKLKEELGEKPNIEAILTRVRRLAEAIGAAKVHDLDGPAYTALGERICALEVAPENRTGW